MSFIEEAKRMIGRPTQQGLEYRAVLPASHEIARIVCSFANAAGGLLVLGASWGDNGFIVNGLSPEFRTEPTIAKALELLEPAPILYHQPVIYRGKRLYVIKVEHSNVAVRVKGSSRDILPPRKYERPLPGPIRQRFAVLVGVNKYVDPAIPPLSFCVQDVVALSAELRKHDYIVVCLHDDAEEERLSPTRENIEAELKHVCEAADPDDLIWVHLACHGKLLAGQPVLLTRETRHARMDRQALPLQEVEETLRSSRARRLVLTLDACHAGVPMGRAVTDEGFNDNVYTRASGFALIAGSTSEQVAQEWQEKQHGVFTFFLLEALSGKADRNRKGFVTVDDVRLYVLDALRRWRVEKGGLLQEPTARTEGMGDIMLTSPLPGSGAQGSGS